MKDKPILFSGPMVRAIQQNIKTMTRRLNGLHEINQFPDDWKVVEIPSEGTAIFFNESIGELQTIVCPYLPGMTLWVRETWQCTGFNDKTRTLAIHFKDGGSIKAWFDDPKRYEQFKKFYFKNGWQSPYFMPQEATRIFLDVKSVRIEWLQEITEEDAKAEGCSNESGIYQNLREEFECLWDSLNQKRGFSWDLNPYVWRITFERKDSQ